MKLYAISGLGADERVFQFLNIEGIELVPIQWISPKSKENISSYARRLSQQIDTKDSFGIIAVSFGGLIAVELSKIINPKIIISISSVETQKELPIIYRIIGALKLIPLIPKTLFDPPRKIAKWIFGAKNNKLLNDILNDTDLEFSK